MDLPVYSPEPKKHSRLPSWLIKKVGAAETLHRMKKDLRALGLHTVCEEAQCPNIGECWSRGTATLMVLGEICTRHCGFCAVTAGKPSTIDPQEPEHAARMTEIMGLKHLVITMVARDDLADGGANHLAQVVQAVRDRNPQTKIEILTSDFQGNRSALATAVEAKPDIFNHNLETVERLTPRVRHRSTYAGSLRLLQSVKEMAPAMTTKSGLMLGLGETAAEIRQALQDLRRVDCQLLTIGQYLRPSLKNLPVVEYVRPEVFEEWKQFAESIGFQNVASGPFVRSSFHAEELATPSWNLNG